MASRYGGSSEYIEEAVADSQQETVLQLEGWAWDSHHEEMLLPSVNLS
jgi:hypothetical protein